MRVLLDGFFSTGAHVNVCVCPSCAAVGGGLFIMLNVSPPAMPLLSQYKAQILH